MSTRLAELRQALLVRFWNECVKLHEILDLCGEASAQADVGRIGEFVERASNGGEDESGTGASLTGAIRTGAYKAVRNAAGFVGVGIGE